jgi:hypothetical protein
MSDRKEFTQQLVVENNIYSITILDHPLIDDVVIAEAMLKAETLVSGIGDPDRRVDRSIRNFLIRLGVET